MNKKGMIQQKGKSVISFISFILFIGTNYCYAQEIAGSTYCKNYTLKNFDSCITFKKNNVFEYHFSGDIGPSDFGIGHYSIKNNYLILNFNLTELNKMSFHKKKYYKNNLDSIYIKLIVKNFSKEAVGSASIFNMKSKQGNITNNNGIGILKLKKGNATSIIEISKLGYQNHKLLINNNYNYWIEVFLNDKEYNPIKNETWKFKILELTKDYIKLKNKNGNILIWKKKN